MIDWLLVNDISRLSLFAWVFVAVLSWVTWFLRKKLNKELARLAWWRGYAAAVERVGDIAAISVPMQMDKELKKHPEYVEALAIIARRKAKQ